VELLPLMGANLAQCQAACRAAGRTTRRSAGTTSARQLELLTMALFAFRVRLVTAHFQHVV
jgi:hypothetical protein